MAAARSAWNAADVRGEVERLIAAEGVVVDAGVRTELAEDLTARAMRACVPLLKRLALHYDRTAITITALARLAITLICARRLPKN